MNGKGAILWSFIKVFKEAKFYWDMEHPKEQKQKNLEQLDIALTEAEQHMYKSLADLGYYKDKHYTIEQFKDLKFYDRVINRLYTDKADFCDNFNVKWDDYNDYECMQYDIAIESVKEVRRLYMIYLDIIKGR